MTDMIFVGSCPVCGGPAQFIEGGVTDPNDRSNTGAHTPSSLTVRAVELPNIDEDLGDGWRLRELHNHGLLNPPDRRWEARATHDGLPDQAEAFGDTPGAAYLAISTHVKGGDAP